MNPIGKAASYAIGLALLLAAGPPAHAGQYRFVGVHPAGKSFCYIEAPHVHAYKPAKASVLYRMHDDQYYFVGDPVAHGYDGPKHTYYGHHPVAIDAVVGDPHGGQHHVEFCYLDGPHYHDYQPPPELSFTVEGGAYWYIGEFPAAYVAVADEQRVGVNAVYEPLRYERPVVEIAPPAGYLGPVVDVRVGARVAPLRPVAVAPVVHGEVRAGVEVHLPMPVLEVQLGVPGVVVVEDHHHHHEYEYKHKSKKKHWKHKRYEQMPRYKKHRR